MLIKVILALIFIPLAVEIIADNGFTFYPPLAQQMNSSSSSSSTNMTYAMMASASMHLRAAYQALMNGNTAGAIEQLSLAQLQISMLGMKSMATLNATLAMDFMKDGGGKSNNFKAIPQNCIILKDGVLECRDPLTQSFSFSR
jgi:hypothetical protein